MSLLSTFENYYMYLSSRVTDLYPQNKPYNFTVRLPSNLNIDQSWSASLLNIVYQNPFSTSTAPILRFYIECDILETSYVCDTDNLRRVLSTVPIETYANKRTNYEIANYQYVKISKIKGVQNITIDINREDGGYIKDFNKDISLAIHFKRNI